MKTLEAFFPYMDDILASFYDEMLSHKHLSVFFESEQAINHLVSIQKQNFIESISDTPEELKSRFYHIGKVHYRLRVPSADFLKSTNIWRTSFIDYAITSIKDIHIVEEVDKYFKLVDSAMCEGFLHEQIKVDEIDISILIKQYQDNLNLESDAAVEHLKWLYKILKVIQTNEVRDTDNLRVENCQVHDFLLHPSEDVTKHFSEEHFDDLHRRLHIDAESLFYFIDKKDFPEALSLYSSLLSAYKITLIALGNFNMQLQIGNLTTDLEETKEELESLKGFITICSYCHHIKNDEGEWEQLEKYISEHSEALFSHGICEKCATKTRAEMEY